MENVSFGDMLFIFLILGLILGLLHLAKKFEARKSGSVEESDNAS